MLGTIVNTLAVVVGGGAGLFLKNGLKERFRTILNQALALAVLFVGISGAVANLLDENAHSLLFILSLAAGALLGELLKIEDRLGSIGDKLEAKLQKNGEKGTFSQGFVAASLLFCVGTMAVLGSLESGVRGNHSILYAKSVLDGVMALVMASTMGVGVLFSGVSVFLYQGLLTLLAVWVSPYLTADMLREMSIVGGVVITAIGLNLLGITKIKIGNFLPAIFLPVLYYAVLGLLH